MRSGGDPTCFGLEPSQWHAGLRERQRLLPFALSATSTHDTKRGEDVRARLNVLSEIPARLEARSAEMEGRSIAASKRLSAAAPAPDPNENISSIRRSGCVALRPR